MNELIQDLETRLANTADPHQKIDLMNSLAEVVFTSDPQRALELAKKALEQSNSGDQTGESYRLGAAIAMLNLGRFNAETNYEVALFHLLEARLIFDSLNDQDHQIETLNLIARVFIYTADYSRALEILLTQLTLIDSSAVQIFRPDTLNNIGLVYLKMRDFSSAFIHLIKANQAAQEVGNFRVMADSLQNLCSLACQQQDFKKALDYGKKSLEIYRKIKHAAGEADALLSLGDAYTAQGNYQQAYRHYNDALQIAYTLAHPRLVMEALIKVGSIHLQQDRENAAEAAFQQALGIAEELKVLQNQYACHHALAEIYKKQGLWEESLHHFERFHALKENVYSEQTHRRIRNYEISYQVELARREAEIQEYRNLALQREIAERTRAEQTLSEVNIELRENIQERDQLINELEAFAHTVAHDLKNPLHTMSLSAQILQRTLPPDRKDQFDHVQIILNTCQSMGNIIDELLLLASVRSQDFSPQIVDMKSIINLSLKRLDAMIKEQQPVIHLPESFPEACGYAPWLEEVWENLISNAIHYGGSPAIIDISAELISDNQVRFSIRDNGDGIKPEDQSRLFTAFGSIQNASRRGHGFGLSIVQRIVNRLGGNVDVSSTGKPGEGTVFSFTLPQKST